MISASRPKLFKMLVDAYPSPLTHEERLREILQPMDCKGRNVLWYAIESGAVQTVQYIIELCNIQEVAFDNVSEVNLSLKLLRCCIILSRLYCCRMDYILYLN